MMTVRLPEVALNILRVYFQSMRLMIQVQTLLKFLLSFLLCLTLPAQALECHLTSAEFIADAQGQLSAADFANGASPPGMMAVTLPDSWRGRDYKQAGYGWYRLHFYYDEIVEGLRHESLPIDTQIWVYLPRLRANGEFFLNGGLIHSGGRMTAPVSRHGEVPFFFPLPATLLHSGDNELLVRIYSPIRPDGGLGIIRLGDQDSLRPQFMKRSLLQNTGVLITSIIMCATSIYILVLWWLRRRPETKGYLFLGIGGFFWAIRNLHYLVLDLPSKDEGIVWMMEVFLHSGNAWFLALTALFFLHDLKLTQSRIMRFFEAGIWAISIVGTLGVWWSGSPYPSLSIMFACGAPFILSMQGILIYNAWKKPTTENVLYALMYLTLIGLLLHDNLTLAGVFGFEAIYLAHYGGLFFFVVVAYMMVRRFVNVLDNNEALNQTLESRVLEREAQLKSNYVRLGEIQKENAMLDERNRIMRDLHDGLGSHLLAALDAVRRVNEPRNVQPELLENHKQEAVLEAEQWINDSLDDLRLAIDSLEINEHDLLTVLGTFRYRIERRLDAAGIALQWEVDNVRPLDWLDAQSVLHFLRIVQEVFTNILKHAKATLIRLEVTESEKWVGIHISDNGKGFYSEGTVKAFDASISTAMRKMNKGHGLANIRYRAEKLDAEVSFQSNTNGTVVTIRLPLNRINTTGQ